MSANRQSEEVKPGTVFIVDTTEEQSIIEVTRVNGSYAEASRWDVTIGDDSKTPTVTAPSPIRFNAHKTPTAEEDFVYEKEKESPDEGFWRVKRLTPVEVTLGRKPLKVSLNHLMLVDQF
ncbi:MAG TPA: hypothetical protein VMR95_02445 [Candidatus Binatia bacterium]|nr:hypothetical protein [Candidatus Binatia bacterium]